MTPKIEKRTTLNGTQWVIEDQFFGGVALLINNFGKEGFHFSGYTFKTRTEAHAFLDEVDERVQHPHQIITCTAVPENYYGVRGRYYGD